MRELALFAGAGGGILGGILDGWRTVAAVEIDPFCREVLLRRQRDGMLPLFPIWDDICTFDGRPFRGRVDVVTGGFPCQDISAAGKGAGITGERSGLWSEMARVIGEVRPQYAFVENSPLLVGRGLSRVLADLTEQGSDSVWDCIGAVDVGAPHRRKRIWILASDTERRVLRLQPGGRTGPDRTDKTELESDGESKPMAHTNSQGPQERVMHTGICRAEERGPQGQNFTVGTSAWWSEDPADIRNTEGDTDEAVCGVSQGENAESSRNGGQEQRPTQSRLGRVADGVANRVDRLKAIGNGQVPAVARLAWNTLLNLIPLDSGSEQG